jgi:hypothetical protein
VVMGEAGVAGGVVIVGVVAGVADVAVAVQMRLDSPSRWAVVDAPLAVLHGRGHLAAGPVVR